VSKKSRRLSPTSRDERRAALAMKRAGEVWPDSVWPEANYQLGVGSYGGLDQTVKRRGKKHPLGFAPPEVRDAR
jgi:hypothetical protein